MMKILNDLLSDVQFEMPIAHGRLRLTPLRLRTGSDLEYRTLDDAETLVTRGNGSCSAGNTSAAGINS